MTEVHIDAHADAAMMRVLRLHGPLVITSYRAGAVIVASTRGRGFHLAVHALGRPMGIARQPDALAVVGGDDRIHLWSRRWRDYRHVTSASLPERCDAHEIVFHTGRWWVVATGRNQILSYTQLDSHPVEWGPKWAVDRDRDVIHLNGYTGPLERGVASCFTTDTTTSWREQPVDRGAIIAAGGSWVTIQGDLIRPHSPRFHKGRLYYLESGRGQIWRHDIGPIAQANGFTRGLTFTRDLLLVGVSKARGGAFDGLPLTGAGECAVRAYTLDGTPAGVLTLDAYEDRDGVRVDIEEIFDLALLAGARLQPADPLRVGDQLVYQERVGAGQTEPAG